MCGNVSGVYTGLTLATVTGGHQGEIRVSGMSDMTTWSLPSSQEHASILYLQIKVLISETRVEREPQYIGIKFIFNTKFLN